LVVLVMLALAGPWLFPAAAPGGSSGVSPSPAHPFGTNSAGQDELAEAVNALRGTLWFGVIAAVVATVLGAVLGSLAGWLRIRGGGVVPRLVSALVVVASPLLAVLWFAASLSGMPWDGLAVALGLGLFGSGWAVRRTVRRVMRAAREPGYVEAARAFGASARRLVYQHVLPNSTDVVLTNFVVGLGQAMLLESAVSFLGLGIHVPDVTLGSLLLVNKPDIVPMPWLLWAPFALIVIGVVSACAVGDGLREARPSGASRASEAPRSSQSSRASRNGSPV
jgi:peptide/nickel transport system permease protein